MNVAVEKSKENVDESYQLYLTFTLAGEEYGVDILRVQEVKVWSKATVLPNNPEYMKGVIDLRGTIVPIIDLRTYFGIESVEYDATTVIIVLQVRLDHRERTIGIVVDSVSGVLDILQSDIKPVDEYRINTKTEALTGVASANSKFVIILNTDRLLDAAEMDRLEGIK